MVVVVSSRVVKVVLWIIWVDVVIVTSGREVVLTVVEGWEVLVVERHVLGSPATQFPELPSNIWFAGHRWSEPIKNMQT